MTEHDPYLDRQKAKRLRSLLKDIQKEMRIRNGSKWSNGSLDTTNVVFAVFSPRLNSYAAHQVADHYSVFEHDLGLFLIAPRYVADWFATSGTYIVSGSANSCPPVQVLDETLTLDVIETAGVLWDLSDASSPFASFVQCVSSAKLLNV